MGYLGHLEKMERRAGSLGVEMSTRDLVPLCLLARVRAVLLRLWSSSITTRKLAFRANSFFALAISRTDSLGSLAKLTRIRIVSRIGRT